MKESRQIYYDFLRGIAIMMVVGIHTFNPSVYAFNTTSGWIVDLARQILNCAVPLFLAISGYFLASKDLSDRKTHISFLKKQVPKIYIPTLIFSLPYLLISIYFADSFKVYLLNIVTCLLCGYSIYYFVVLIIQYYLLLPWMYKHNNRAGLIVASAISFVNIIVLTYIQKVLNVNLPLIIYAGSFTLWFVFFFLGVYLRKHSRDYSLFFSVSVVIIGIVGSLIENRYWMRYYGSPLFGIKCSSFVYSAGIILLLFSSKFEKRFVNTVFTRSIIFLGNISFGIYLLHYYLISFLSQYIPENWFVAYGFVLIITILIIVLTKRVLPNLSGKYLGFFSYA